MGPMNAVPFPRVGKSLALVVEPAEQDHAPTPAVVSHGVAEARFEHARSQPIGGIGLSATRNREDEKRAEADRAMEPVDHTGM